MSNPDVDIELLKALQVVRKFRYPNCHNLLKYQGIYPEAKVMFLRLNIAGVKAFPSDVFNGETAQLRVRTLLTELRDMDQQ